MSKFTISHLKNNLKTIIGTKTGSKNYLQFWTLDKLYHQAKMTHFTYNLSHNIITDCHEICKVH